MQFFESCILINFANMRKILWMVGLFLNSFAFAQLSEDFSDGEMVHQPAWMGDTGRFMVNNSFQLQSKSFYRSDTAYLSTSSSYNQNAVWEFYVQMNFDPSTGNLFRYYFISDNQFLNQSLNGYYLQIGESGSSDSYDLFRQTNNSSTKIIDVTGDEPVEYKGVVPARSVVIPGSYTKKFPAGDYQVPCAIIIGQRKPSTDLKTSLNDALREYNVAV